MSKIFFIAFNNSGAPGDWQEKGKEIEGGRGECMWNNRTQEFKVNEPNSFKINSYYFISTFSLCENYYKDSK